MLRTTRPLLNSAQRLALAGRAAPHVRPAALSGSPTNTLRRLSQQKVGASSAIPLAFRAGYSTKLPLQPNKRDKEFEKEVAQKIIQPRPDEVSAESSVRHVIEDSQAPPPDSDADVAQGLKGDLVC